MLILVRLVIIFRNFVIDDKNEMFDNGNYLIFFSLLFSMILKDIATGKSFLFAPRLPTEYAVWLGEIKPLSYYKVS